MADHQYYMHVNYIENIFPIKEICARCAQAGYDGIELRDRDRSGQTPLDEYLNQTYEATSSNNLGLVYGSRLNTTAEDTSQRKESAEHCRKVIDFAGDHGVSLLNTFGGPINPPGTPPGQFDQTGSNVASDEQWKSTVDMLADAADHAKTKGITLCLEMHNMFIHDLAEPTARLLDLIDRDNVKANFDAGNIILHPDNQGLDQELARIQDRLGYVHLKNMISFQKPFNSTMFKATPLRDGDINNFVLLRNLLKTYTGILAIENTMSGDKRPFMHEDLAYLKSLVRDAG